VLPLLRIKTWIVAGYSLVTVQSKVLQIPYHNLGSAAHSTQSWLKYNNVNPSKLALLHATEWCLLCVFLSAVSRYICTLQQYSDLLWHTLFVILWHSVWSECVVIEPAA
jgi:hypothetical protein